MQRRQLKSKAYQRHYYLTHKEPKAHGAKKRKLRDIELVVRCGFEDPEPRSKQWRKYELIQYEYHQRGVVNWDLSVKETLSNREEFLQQYNFARSAPSADLRLEKTMRVTQGDGLVGFVIIPQKGLAAVGTEPILPSLPVVPEILGDAYVVEESGLGLLTPAKHIPYGNDENIDSEVRLPAGSVNIQGPQPLGTPGSPSRSQSKPVTKLKIRRWSPTKTLTHSSISPLESQSPVVPMDLMARNPGRDGRLLSNEEAPYSVGDSSIWFMDRQAPSCASTPLTEGGILTSLELPAESCDSSSSLASCSTAAFNAGEDAPPQVEPNSERISVPQTIESFLPRPGLRQAILGTGSSVVKTPNPRRSRHKSGKRSAVSKALKPSSVKSESCSKSREEYFRRREEYKKALDAQFKLYNTAEVQAIHHGSTDTNSNREVQKLAKTILKLIRDWGHVTQPEPSIKTLLRVGAEIRCADGPLSSRKYDPQLVAQVEKEYDAFTVWYNEEEDRLTLGYTDDTLYYFLEDYEWSHQCQDKMIHRLQQRRSQVESWYEAWVNCGVKG